MAAIPIITIVGFSNAGKTRCATRLISILSAHGYRVASAKHCHDGFAMDTPGKDSWKHKQAGAVTAIVSSRGQVGVIADLPAEPTLAELCAKYAHGADLLLAEGYSWERYPRILVASRQRLAEERAPADDLLLALVGPRLDGFNGPCFTFGQMEGLAALVEARIPAREPAHGLS